MFSEALADELAARGVTQAYLAERVGVKQSTVARWLDDHPPEVSRVFDIEAALQLKPGTLSQHLGYLPAGALRPCTISEAIRTATEIEDYQREALLSVYRSFAARR